MRRLSLGCPNYCEGWTCIDLNPKDSRVMKADATDFLIGNPDSAEELRSKNMLEHLPNPGMFLHACEFALKKGGRLTLITDNAEFLPFYAPFVYVHHTGIGAHMVDAYATKICGSKHYSIFTKMHLRNLIEDARLTVERIDRVWYGARLEAVAVKRAG